jgi:sec-independent protein translocase protein TatA
MNAMLVGGLGTTELLIIFGVIVLLFGASKLPELARGSGRALRIFKAETKGLMDDDDETKKSGEAKPADGAELPGGTTSAEQVETPESARRADPA